LLLYRHVKGISLGALTPAEQWCQHPSTCAAGCARMKNPQGDHANRDSLKVSGYWRPSACGVEVALGSHGEGILPGALTPAKQWCQHPSTCATGRARVNNPEWIHVNRDSWEVHGWW
jgi:uncharacterized Fe-S cluster protein YjdI